MESTRQWSSTKRFLIIFLNCCVHTIFLEYSLVATDTNKKILYWMKTKTNIVQDKLSEYDKFLQVLKMLCIY